MVSVERSPGVELRFLNADRQAVSKDLGKVDGVDVVRGQPVRTFPMYRGQQNYPGLLWCATTRTLIGYESLLERDRLWLADFDPAVRWIASQPFWLSGRDGSTLRRHAPDFLLQTTNGYTVVDVKPEPLLEEPGVAEVLAWTGRLCAAKGWAYEVWSGADPVLLRNVRFLAAGRRPGLVEEPAVVKLAEQLQPGMTVADVVAGVDLDAATARAAVLALLWRGAWMTDLTRPLSPHSALVAGTRAACRWSRRCRPGPG